MDVAGIKGRLAIVFEVRADQVDVREADSGQSVVAKISADDPEDREGVRFTFAQMMQLPGVFGTERLDFETEAGHSRGSSWTGDYGHYNRLTIRARA